MKFTAHRAAAAACGVLLPLGFLAGPALAAHAAATGQPSAECEDVRPGHASNAPGSAFNEDGVAGTRYAGEQPQNSGNPHSVSQYDVACIRVEQHH